MFFDDKIAEMGSYRAILYLPDESPRLRNALTHPGMKNYVRPMSHFIGARIPDLIKKPLVKLSRGFSVRYFPEAK